MLNYFENLGIGLEGSGIKMPPYNPEVLQAAKELQAAVEGMSDEHFDKILGEIQTGFCKWLDSDNENYYGALEAVKMEYSLESAYNKDRSIFKSALIRLRMAFSIFTDNRATADYISVLKDIDPSNVSQITSNAVLTKGNVEAFVKVMGLVNTSLVVDNRDLEKAMRELSNELHDKMVKLVITLFTCPVPVVQFLGIAYSLYILYTLPQMAEDARNKYAEAIKLHISKVFKASGIAKEAGVSLDSTGKFDTSEIIKMANVINRLKSDMMPAKVRSQVGRPNFLKSKVPLNYDEKVAIVNTIKANSNTILRTIGDSPIQFNNAMRFALSADQVTQNLQEGTAYGIVSEDVVFMGLCENLMVLTLDAITVACLLVVDLKKY